MIRHSHKSLILMLLLTYLLQYIQWFRCSIQWILMSLQLRIDSTKLQIITNQFQLTMKHHSQFLCLSWLNIQHLLTHIYLVITLQKCRDIVYYSLNIISWFLQLPNPLIHTSQIMQYSQYQWSINSFTTTSTIFQSQFSLTQKHNSFIKFFPLNRLITLHIKIL